MSIPTLHLNYSVRRLQTPSIAVYVLNPNPHLSYTSVNPEPTVFRDIFDSLYVGYCSRAPTERHRDRREMFSVKTHHPRRPGTDVSSRPATAEASATLRQYSSGRVVPLWSSHQRDLHGRWTRAMATSDKAEEHSRCLGRLLD